MLKKYLLQKELCICEYSRLTTRGNLFQRCGLDEYSDKQLLPVLAFGSHLWNFKKTSVVRTVNSGFRKGVRKVSSMKQRECLSERFPDRFSKADAKMKRHQLRFLTRATLSCNTIFGWFAWYVRRHKMTCRGIGVVGKNLFAARYNDM